MSEGARGERERVCCFRIVFTFKIPLLYWHPDPDKIQSQVQAMDLATSQ